PTRGAGALPSQPRRARGVPRRDDRADRCGSDEPPDAPPARAGQEGPPPVEHTPLRRNRDFILLWSGQVVSTVGTRVTAVAFPLLVLAQTHSPAKAGLVGFAQTLPYMLFYLPAGALVDRWDRRRTMIVADAGRTLALRSLAIALAFGDFTFAQVFVVAFVEAS